MNSRVEAKIVCKICDKVSIVFANYAAIFLTTQNNNQYQKFSPDGICVCMKEDCDLVCIAFIKFFLHTDVFRRLNKTADLLQ